MDGPFPFQEDSTHKDKKMTKPTQRQINTIADLLFKAGKYPTRAAAEDMAKGLPDSEAASKFIKDLNKETGWNPATAPMSSDQWLQLADLEADVFGEIKTLNDDAYSFAKASARISMLRKHIARHGVKTNG